MPETRDLFEVSCPIRQPLGDIDNATIRRTLAGQMDDCAAALHQWRLDLDDVLLEQYAVVRIGIRSDATTTTIPISRLTDRADCVAMVNGHLAAAGDPPVGPAEVELVAVRTRVVEEVNTPLRGFAGPVEQG